MTMTTYRNPGALLYRAHLSLAGAQAGSPELRRELYDFHTDEGKGGGNVERVLWDNLHAEAAQCLNEAIIDAEITWWDSLTEALKPGTPQWVIDMMGVRDWSGSYGMRYTMRHLAFEVQAVWLTIQEQAFAVSLDFDFRFCPWVIQWVDWKAIGSDQIAHLKPGVAEAAQKWVAGDE
jgi:hypothetical protein